MERSLQDPLPRTGRRRRKVRKSTTLWKIKCNMVSGIQLGPYHLTDLEYADDVAIFATNQNDISSELAIFDTEASKLGVRTSCAKNKILKFCDAPSPPSLRISATIMSNLLISSPAWALSSPTRATFNLISTAALYWRPESCDR